MSLRTGQGFEEFLAELTRHVADRLDDRAEAPALTRARHRFALEEAVAALSRAASMKAPELFAEDLRLAVRWIGRITGRMDVEELLDVIFADFCIGK